jgi:hypothetical protein
MNVLVMLDETPEDSLVLAQVNSGPSPQANESPSRDVVTLYGVPSAETLALALAAALESRRAAVQGAYDPDTIRQVGVWPGRGAVGDAAWRDRLTGQLVTRDLVIPLDVLRDLADSLLVEFGQAIRRLVAGLLMPDWPEGTRRAITFTFAPVLAVAGLSGEAMLAEFREADGLSYDFEEN